MRILLLLICSALTAGHPAVIKEEFVFTKAPSASCHASTLTETASGTLLCAWFGGSEEGAKDVQIWLSSLEGVWPPPQVVAKADGVACWNPVLFTMPSQEILLFYKAGPNPQQWSGLLKRSLDGGKSWSIEEPLPAGVFGPIKNRPLLLPDGTLLCGSSMESWRRWGCWIDLTVDAGRSWTKSTPINVDGQLFGIIQPALFPRKSGEIMLLARSNQIGAICSATSTDGGKTWSSAEPTAIVNPNSGIDAMRLQDGRILLVYNDSVFARTPLNVALSDDDGETCTMVLTLEDLDGEFSYPSVMQTSDGLVHITYTWNHKRIKHLVLDANQLQIPELVVHVCESHSDLVVQTIGQTDHVPPDL